MPPRAGSGELEVYTGLPTKVAVLAWRLIRNHPLPDGNARAGYLSLLEFLARNGGRRVSPSEDPEGDEVVAMIGSVAAGTTDERAFATWVATRLG